MADRTITVPFILDRTLQPDAQYKIEIYNSELLDWVEGQTSSGKELERLAARIEGKGFRIFRFREA